MSKKIDEYTMFIKQCIKQLKDNRICYCYNLNQAEAIKNKFKKELDIVKNECGYTLSTHKKEVNRNGK